MFFIMTASAVRSSSLGLNHKISVPELTNGVPTGRYLVDNNGKIVYLIETVRRDAKLDTKKGVYLDFTKDTVLVETITCFLPISKELSQDDVGLKSYIDGRLPKFLAQAEEQYAFDQIVKAASKMHRRFWETKRKAIKRATKKARRGGLRVNVVLDYAKNRVVPEGQVLIGASEGATVWRGPNVQVVVNDEHLDYFRKPLWAIRANGKTAVTVFRPESFVLLHL